LSEITDPPSSSGTAPRAGGRILALDLGTVRIGVAISDSRQILATPHEVIRRTEARAGDHHRIAKMVDELAITEVVVGLPLSLSGRDSGSSRAVKIEVAELRDLLEVPVSLADERLSSVEANARREEIRQLSNAVRRGGRGGTARTFGKKGTPKGPAVIDDLAAAIILQAFLDRRLRESGKNS
jgi:putative Holliday junction resolvase